VALHTAAPTTQSTPPSLRDALPIWGKPDLPFGAWQSPSTHTVAWFIHDGSSQEVSWMPYHSVDETSCELPSWMNHATVCVLGLRSEEHTSELQSRREIVCRLLLEKK